MCEIIRFPKTKKAAEFYQFLVRWNDGAEFYGRTLEECFIKQKNVFEPEFTMDEYLNRFKHRLKVVTGTDFNFTSIDNLCHILSDLGYLEILESDIPDSALSSVD